MRTDDLKQRTIYIKFDIGDTVYHKTEMMAKMPGIVTGIVVRPQGNHYYVSWGSGNSETGHFDMELTRHFIKDFETDNAEEDDE